MSHIGAQLAVQVAVHQDRRQEASHSASAAQLVIVRRGQFATFALLAKALVEEPRVRVIWDRRLQDRRREPNAIHAGDRRGPDRRAVSVVWANHDYLMVNTTALDRPANILWPGPSHYSAGAAAGWVARDLEIDIEVAAATTVNLMISGGDPLSRRSLAEQVHRQSPYATSPITVIDRQLAAALFDPERPGAPMEFAAFARLEPSKGRGTWLLEEVGDLSWQQQTGLLRFLDHRAEEPSDALSPAPRLITATDYWLYDRVTASRFRPDVFCRLNTIHILLPAGVVASAGADMSRR